jgi:hypothetical protein
MDGLSLKSEKKEKIRGELADCCMLYGGKIIIEGGSSHCTHPLQQKSLYRRGRAGVWQAEIIVEGRNSLCTPSSNPSSSSQVHAHSSRMSNFDWAHGFRVWALSCFSLFNPL